jgi:ankyrin repeat protein
MTSAPRRSLPARPDLDQQRKLARELLRAFERNDSGAITRVRAELPDKQRILLTDAQFVLAREYGFASWRDLKSHIDRVVQDAKPPLEQFRRAVQRGEVATLRRLLTRFTEVRAAINEPIFGFDSPALAAVSGRGNVELVDVLLEAGADPNRKTSWWAGGFHPLYSASGAVADRLIAAGAVVDACAAAHLDRPDILAELLRADPSRVHERGGDGQTPLHFARSRAIADMLLDGGADVNARDLDHRATAAEWMLGDADNPVKSRLELARYLVERGASADIFLIAALGLTHRATQLLDADPSQLNLRTSQGQYDEQKPSSYHIYQWTIGPNLTPLQVASKFGQLETLGVMQRYASPAQRLLLACHRGDAKEARAIAVEHPGLVDRLGPDDRRALTDEAWTANAPAVRLLLELGFDPSVPGVSGPVGGTALHCAAWEGSAECVEALLSYDSGRALITVRDPNYQGTPLGWCAHGSTNCGNPRADHGKVARLLIAAGTVVEPDMLEWGGSDGFQEAIAEALRGR